ncbi:MAG: flavodoxin family protein [Solobacterium sp.]|nr:flavodoxin family protein [Solobacterium sp.]
MKKVLIISSSPRKGGNSDRLAAAFEQGAKDAGNEVTFVRLSEKKIGYCMACGYCHSHGNVCVLKDDMAEILRMMKQADVFVLASPVYFYNVCAQMKTFIDRTYPCFFQLRRKELYYICTSADPDFGSIDGALKAFNGFEICLPYGECKGVIYGTDNPNHGDIEGKPQLAEAYEMGKAV